ncbi:MAG: anti-sigma factor family protein [Acidobacteriaceae bacterium]
MTCRNIKSDLEEILLEPEHASQAVREHLAACEACRRELVQMQATFALLDEWQAPAANPYFTTRMQALLREEKAKQPAGWLERLRMRVLLTNRTARPVAAVALVLALLIGGGTYAGIQSIASQQAVVVPKSATLRDLQSLDQNAEVFQQLNDIDQYDAGGNSSNTGSM